MLPWSVQAVTAKAMHLQNAQMLPGLEISLWLKVILCPKHQFQKFYFILTVSLLIPKIMKYSLQKIYPNTHMLPSKKLFLTPNLPLPTQFLPSIYPYIQLATKFRIWMVCKPESEPRIFTSLSLEFTCFHHLTVDIRPEH